MREEIVFGDQWRFIDMNSCNTNTVCSLVASMMIDVGQTIRLCFVM